MYRIKNNKIKKENYFVWSCMVQYVHNKSVVKTKKKMKCNVYGMYLVHRTYTEKK